MIFIIGGIVFVAAGMFTASLIAPKRPNPEKLASYECGEEAVGSSWVQFNMRFYVVALIFIIFDVEILFVVPWSVIFSNKDLVANVPNWTPIVVGEMFLFIGVLFLGLVYAWAKGDLSWVKPQILDPEVDVKIPRSVYDKINQKMYKPKPFTPPVKKATPQVQETVSQTVETNTENSTAENSNTVTKAPIRRKPIIKKEGE
ncbi:MAG: NADH-quinone oxidoreductase subunit A [Bacteroidia bacterium]|nr:NADH-quinone oxidoreductase subunit A [Bacteroidia bacterium]MDW8345706.1 NADH-quinone oxidoreductase subunit A [Bacteroidia bacterium]